VERVYAAFADPVLRAQWAAPSDTAQFVYDETDFRVGGRDLFRCGAKSNLQYQGVTLYHDIEPGRRIVSSETVETGGTRILVSLSTVVFEPEGNGTRIAATIQLASLAGEAMIEAATVGHNASLDNLVKAMV
jgi:uncharacterized protein YndB with AHSA1/START domain